MAGHTTLGQLRAQAEPWVSRPAREPAGAVVDSPDRADVAVWDKVFSESATLRMLDHHLTKTYGVTGLVGDLWMAAYARDPQLLDPDEVTPRQRSRRATAAAVLGTPEHRELREATTGDAYSAALSVLSMQSEVETILARLDGSGAGRAEHQAQAETDQRTQQVRDALDAAEHAATDSGSDDEADDEQTEPGETPASPDDGDNQDPGNGGASETDVDGDGPKPGDDLPVPRPETVDVQRAITEAEAAEQEEAAAAAALAEAGEDDPAGEEAALEARAVLRQACADAAEEIADQAAAMTSWGLGTQIQERLDADTRLRLAEKLRSDKMKKFAELIGRFAQMARAQRANRVEHARGEYVGVTIGDDLTSLIPAELVNLAVPALRADFAVRYAEKQLMVYEQRGEEHEGQGAIIACVDVSGSMKHRDSSGFSREAYAKAMALALLDQARGARPVRDCVVITFAKTVREVFRFPAEHPVDLMERIRLAEDPLAGGTDFEPPLERAVELLAAEYNTVGRSRGDIVFITDGEAVLGEDWLQWWRTEKKRLGFRCFGLRIDQDARTWNWKTGTYEANDVEDSVLDDFCDDARGIEDLANTHATADLFRAI
ncbi:hypothetical protein DMC63_37830 [Streptomyces sp. WAC 05977]|nr:hypothetical protein DMC63_37830 [Streptomyces sp. WAC 05977]